MKKRVLATVLAGAMAACMIAGCGSTSTNTTTAAADTEAADTEAADTEAADSSASGDMTTIRVMRACFNVVPDSGRTQEVQDAINAYIGDKIGVQIELSDISSGEYTEKANLAIANNEVDLVWTASWEGTIGTNDLIAANAVKDITDLIAGTDLYNSMDENTWVATQNGGRNYFIPVYKDNVEGYNLMIRKQVIEDAGLDVSSITSLADCTALLEQMSDLGLKYPYTSIKTAMFYRYYIDSFDFFTADATSNWVSVDRDTDEVVDTILTPEYKEFCTLMAEWAEAGYMSEDDVTKTTNDAVAQTEDWGISWWTDVPNNDEASTRNGQEVEVIKITNNYLHTDSALGSCYAITAAASDEAAKAAIDFMGLLYTDSSLADLYTYGIEGTDFNYDADGYVEKVADATYNHSMWESASATVVTAPSDSPYTAQMYLDFNGSAEISCANGFHFDKTPVEDKYAACQSVFEQYGFVLENGGYAVDQIDQAIEDYQAALDGAGYQDVLAEFTEQYNNWKSGN